MQISLFLCYQKSLNLNKKIFVVIVTYNGAKWIDKNITSLQNSSYPVSIIAIDNDSSDNSVALLEKYPEVDLIKSPENLGFGKANNIGVKKAMGQGADYIFLLNQDAWVFENTINNLVGVIETNAGYGIVSPLHYNADEVAFDANFKTYYDRGIKGTGHLVEVPFVNAAAWMMSRICVERIGVFEPMFSHYGEDRNYCERVQYHNLQIGIDEGSKIVHDRIIVRNFKKDIVQSQYKILCTLLNINNNIVKSYLLALREVFGLPKYFLRSYKAIQVLKMFFILTGYYFTMLFSAARINYVRNSHK
jgi:GT2 family glycosyltransferase